MRLPKATLPAAILMACFIGGLFGAPLARVTYARLFPPPEFVAGDYSKLYAEAGKPVVLFSTSTCPYCKKTRALFDAAGVQYADYVIDESESAEQKFKDLGGSAVPLVFIGQREIRGFREAAIRNALALTRSPSPAG